MNKRDWALLMLGTMIGLLIANIIFDEMFLTPLEMEWWTSGHWLNGYKLYDFDWYEQKITVYSVGRDYLIYHDYCRC